MRVNSMQHDVITESNLAEISEFLSQPSAYPGRPRVEVRETHISLVFLAGSEAYKLKKPVKFDFLDFSSPALRKQACDAEVRLNRRLSPSVYLGVIPICRDADGNLQLGKDEAAAESTHPVDWLVKMRRLEDDRTFGHLLANLADADAKSTTIRKVASHLARFYADQAPATVRPGLFRRRLLEHVESNESQLLSLTSDDEDRNQIFVIHNAQRRFLATHRELFDARVLDGRIVDGHGDLRPDHIYAYRHPLVIDCIEFNSEYRTNDIIDELAFLAMTCDRIGETSVGPALFAAYEAASHDKPDAQLIDFYKSYRACVRAKVAGLRGEQQSRGDAIGSEQKGHDYLDLAARYVKSLGPRMLLMIGGLMGTGKSTLARQLQTLLSAEVVSADEVRQEMTAEAPIESVDRAKFGGGKYTMEARLANYEQMIEQATPLFQRNNTVLLDATFCHRDMRELAVEMAATHGAVAVQVDCACPREEAIARIEERNRKGGSSSEALPEFYDFQLADTDPAIPDIPLVTIDTTLALAQQEDAVLAEISRLASPPEFHPPSGQNSSIEHTEEP